MTNAEWMIKNKKRFIDLWCTLDGRKKCYRISLDYGEWLGVIPVSESVAGEQDALMTWLGMEHKEPILDVEERFYLRTLVHPFKDKVKFIRKRRDDYPGERCEYLLIVYELCGNNCSFSLPDFKAGKMYKGMKLEKDYTLKELDLD